MNRWRINAALIIVLVALGLTAWWLPDASTKKAAQTLTTLVPSDIKTIRITQPHQKTAVINRNGEGWRMTKPVSARADTAVIQAWLRSLNEVADHSYQAGQLDLKQLGLESPKLTLKLNNQVFKFGALAPISHQRYIKNSSSILLVNDILFFQLQGNPLSFISKQLLPSNASIESIKLPHSTITKNAKSHWKLKPKQPNVNTDTIQELINAWTRVQAIDVKPLKDNKAKSGPEIAIKIKSRKQPIRFYIIKTKPHIELARPDWNVLYSLPTRDNNRLLSLTNNTHPQKTDRK